MEYLVTYGWAIVLVATILGALAFTVTAPEEAALFKSSDPTKIMVKGASVGNGMATIIRLQNITGGEISIQQVTSSEGYESCVITPEETPSGGILTILCDVEGNPDGTIHIAYTDRQGLERTVSIYKGTLMPATAPAEAGEICTDGINNDSDGLIDCADTDCGGKYCDAGETKVCSDGACVPGSSLAGCGTISESGTYTLGQDVSNQLAPCIVIAASDATLDCQGRRISIEESSGFSIIHPPGAVEAGVYGQVFNNITVKNCRISSKAAGIFTNGETSNANILNNILTGNSGFGILQESSNSTIAGNTILNNGEGIAVYSADSTISNNTICGNSRDIRCEISGSTGLGNNIGAGGTFCGGIQANACGATEICSDSIDNDSDSLIDCADQDCAGASGAQGQECQPGNETLCEDAGDNDGDNLADCSDPDCEGIPWCEPREIGLACLQDGECVSGQCADGVCCSTACTGTCEACNLTGSAGTCAAGTGIGGGQCLGPELTVNGGFSTGESNWSFGEVGSEGWRVENNAAQFGPGGMILGEWALISQVPDLEPLENRTYRIAFDVVRQEGPCNEAYWAEFFIGSGRLGPDSTCGLGHHEIDLDSGGMPGFGQMSPFWFYASSYDESAIYAVDNISVKEKFAD